MSKLYSWTPDELLELLGHHTTITLKDNKNTVVQGYIYTIDPDSHHVVLFHDKAVKVVMHHAIQDIKIDNENHMDLQTIDEILKYQQENQFTEEWIDQRRNALIQHFEANRIPIQIKENEPVIYVLGSARVESPYVATSVVCDNALIRKRVRDIILQLSRSSS